MFSLSIFKVYLPNLQNFRILSANFLFTHVLKLYAYKKPGKLSTIPFFPLANYHMLETNLRSETRGGGVGIYEKNHLSFKILKHY